MTPSTWIVRRKDMAITDRSSLDYLERAGLVPTVRGPASTFDPDNIALKSISLQPPLPLAEFVPQGDPPPDRGETQEWPHGSQ